MILSLLERRAASARSTGEVPQVSPLTHLIWFGVAVLLFFAMSWIGTSLLRLDNDLYYAIFVWTGLTFLYGYARLTRIPLSRWFGTGRRLSLFLGLLAAVYLVVNVLRAPGTARPSGLLLLFEVLWRGVAYGVVTALVLAAFPVMVAVGVLGGRVAAVRRRLLCVALSLPLTWTLSGAYHLGFDQFGPGDLGSPQIGSTAVVLPAAISTNPIGSVVAQTTLHVAATLHAYESQVFVPPHVEFVPAYHPPGVFGPH